MLQVASAHHPDVVLLGDAGETSAALLRAVEPNRREGWRSLDVAATIAEDLRPAMLADEPADVEPGRLDPRKVVIEVDAELPDDCVVVSGAGHFCFFTPPFLTWKRSRRFVHVAEFGAIGQAVPTSLGIALGGSPVVLFEGDASLLMVAQELDTARRYDIPVLLVILNDEALGAELHRMRDDPLACGLMQVSTPDLAYLAEAFGITGTRIDEPGQAAAAVARWRADPKPTLLDVRVSQRVVATKLVDDF